MNKRVKYEWELMHGDGDHYDRRKIMLSNENDINFFDYVTSLKFEENDCVGFDDVEESEKIKLYELYKLTQWYNAEISTDMNWEYNMMETLTDDIGYISSDITSGGWHYAQITYFKRKEFNK